MKNHPYISCIILAGGTGNRMNSSTPKQYLPLMGKPICQYSVEKFSSLKEMISEIIVVCDPAYETFFTPIDIPITFASNGATRQESLYNGIQKTSQKSRYICVHDAARPLVKRKDLINFLEKAIQYPGAALGIPATSTIKRCSKDQMVIETLDRSTLWEIQTPQMAKKESLLEALQKAKERNIPVTDDLSLIELLKLEAKIFPSDPSNIKITHSIDLTIAQALLKSHEEE